jgi:F-box domain
MQPSRTTPKVIMDLPDMSSGVQPSRTTPKTIMDLPDELLLEIIQRVGTYRQVQSLRDVCPRFDDVCVGMIRRAFIKFKVS